MSNFQKLDRIKMLSVHNDEVGDENAEFGDENNGVRDECYDSDTTDGKGKTIVDEMMGNNVTRYNQAGGNFQGAQSTRL